MTLTFVALFAIFALLYASLLPAKWRQWALHIGSIVFLFALQPELAIRNLGFIVSLLTLVLVIIVWMVTRNRTVPISRDDKLTFIVTLITTGLLAGTRYLPPEYRFIEARPPEFIAVLLLLLIPLLIAGLIWKLPIKLPSLLSKKWLVIYLLVIVLVILKTEVLAEAMAGFLRSLTGQQVELASVGDLGWLGISYIAFRLIHLIRDRQQGLLPALGLREHITYVIFFPSLASGPIDRAERFSKDWQALPTLPLWVSSRLIEGGGRIVVGLVKKFVIADTLAIIALNDANALQTTQAGSLWVMLYAFAFRLFFDFSGYSDIVIGIGIWLGVRLPENFNQPYLKNSITAFWQSWHITLSTWVRSYVFSPLSRKMVVKRVPQTRAVLIAQLTTMITIGLWHGVTLPFIVWGAWHGLGLFFHKLWSDRTRKRYLHLKKQPQKLRLWTWFGIFITFHFVVIGWVWFALSNFETAFITFGRLFGVGF